MGNTYLRPGLYPLFFRARRKGFVFALHPLNEVVFVFQPEPARDVRFVHGFPQHVKVDMRYPTTRRVGEHGGVFSKEELHG